MPNMMAGVVSSHAYAFLSPAQWDARRTLTRDNYQRLQDKPPPPESPEFQAETLTDNLSRHKAIRDGFQAIRDLVQNERPDVIVLIGDDQNENFTDLLRPQFALFTGAHFTIGAGQSAVGYQVDNELAHWMLLTTVEAGFDMAWTERLPEDRLLDHAHHEPLRFIDPQGGIPVVPVFLNSIHHPGPTPRRCYDLGRALRVAIETYAPGKRILVYSSGGFSHFTAGYPWRHYHGPHTLGSISVEFDQEIVARLRAGDQERLAELSSQDLLDNGQVELRQTIVLAGMLRTGAIPDFLHYVPFYRAGMGIAVGIWRSP